MANQIPFLSLKSISSDRDQYVKDPGARLITFQMKWKSKLISPTTIDSDAQLAIWKLFSVSPTTTKSSWAWLSQTTSELQSVLVWVVCAFGPLTETKLKVEIITAVWNPNFSPQPEKCKGHRSEEWAKGSWEAKKSDISQTQNLSPGFTDYG